MIRLDDHLVLTPQLTPTLARLLVMASWKADDETPPLPLHLEGNVTGPRCEYAETLVSRVALQPEPDISSKRQAKSTRLTAIAGRILEPCFWEPQHPFCYEILLQLRDDETVLDMRQIVAGIRHLAVRKMELLLNGKGHFLQGVRHDSTTSIAELEAWHETECGAFLVHASDSLCEQTDRWGPMVLHLLPTHPEEARDQVVRLRNHPSVLMWVLPAETSGMNLAEFVATIRSCDPSRPIGQIFCVDQQTEILSPVDVHLLQAGHPEVGTLEPAKPYIVVSGVDAHSGNCDAENFTDQIAEFRKSLGTPPGLVGVILCSFSSIGDSSWPRQN